MQIAAEGIDLAWLQTKGQGMAGPQNAHNIAQKGDQN